MSVSQMFQEFLSNLAVDNERAKIFSNRYGEITRALNQEFRKIDSKESYSLKVGSYGRWTGIKGISDLDMLYIMPASKWNDYNKQGGRLRLLQDTRSAIASRYSTTKVKIDTLVVCVTFTDFHVEVQPVFAQADNSFLYPNTKYDEWKLTKPREEMDAAYNMNIRTKGNYRKLCKMVRAWRNECNLAMGGLLIDTLVHKFFEITSYYDDKSYHYYDEMVRDFFEFLSELPEQSEYGALGSNQRVKVKQKFQPKAKKAYSLCLEAIEAETQKNVNDKWRKVFGRNFPAGSQLAFESALANDSMSFKNTEEFIDDKFSIDITETLNIDCEISQNGFRKFLLSQILKNKKPLYAKKDLLFKVTDISVEKPYEIYWKILNRGIEAERRDCIRGQIRKDEGWEHKSEKTSFLGDHIVECYCVKDGVVVAKDRIKVPIINDGRDYD